MFDLIVRGGDVVTPEGVVRCDVAVAGETIAAIATPGALPEDSAKHLIDATGHIVMPGGISITSAAMKVISGDRPFFGVERPIRP